MKLYDGGILIICIVMGAVIIGGFSAKFLKKDDGIIEEVCEDVIQVQTGQKIDLTPASPEK